MSSTETTQAVSQVANVIVPVSDQDLQLRFYTETLGLEKRADIPFGNGDRWIEVGAERRRDPDRALPSGPRQRGRRQGHRDLPADRRHRRLPRRSSRSAAPTSTTRSAAWATRCRRSSGSATPRATH